MMTEGWLRRPGGSELMFGRELKQLIDDPTNEWTGPDISRLIARPEDSLTEEGQWVRLIAIQAGLEIITGADRLAPS